VAYNEIIDASIMNEIALQRFIRREVRLMLRLFESFDKKLAQLVRKLFRQGMDVTSKEYATLLNQIKTLRDEMVAQANQVLRSTLSNVAPVEHNKEWALLVAALGLTGRKPKRPTVGSSLRVPFSSGAASAATLVEWLTGLRNADLRRIREALALALVQGESTDLAVARVVGTKDQLFRDGVVARTRNNIRALVATAIAHVVQSMREALWVAVPQIAGMIWVSILDASTTAICRARDNRIVLFGDHPLPDGARLLQPQGARPPAHPNCRSRMVALPMGAGMPDRETFEDFLKAQSAIDQNKILGKTKAGMFRRGEASLNDFVDDTGKELTLTELQAA
jgi:hypothetical protein